jgi:hypothetical protein
MQRKVNSEIPNRFRQNELQQYQFSIAMKNLFLRDLRHLSGTITAFGTMNQDNESQDTNVQD